MSFKIRLSYVVGACALALGAGALALDPPAKGQPEGLSAEAQACVLAGTPGKQHAFLQSKAGVWSGKTQVWMTPDATEVVRGVCTWTVTSVLDGRFVRGDISGELPGMGTFTAVGHSGFDNVTQKYVSSWVNSCGTGIMNGVGELSADGKALTWTFTSNCPIQKKPTTLREVHTYTGENSIKFELFMKDAKSGKEYRWMLGEFTRGV